jgi:peptidoglycan/xylan/chitin deacetylase (PgdA/CDA1 family)
MKHKIVSTLRNPIIMVLPVVVLLLAAWQYHVQSGRNLDLPGSRANLMVPAGPEPIQPDELPAGWELQRSGDNSVAGGQDKGHISNRAMKVYIGRYDTGDINLVSPKMPMQGDQTNQKYIFKSYFKTDVPMQQLVHYYYEDGSDQLLLLRGYDREPGVWSTASHAFQVPASIAAVQFVYRVSGEGTLLVDSPYLEPKQEVFIAAAGNGWKLGSLSGKENLLPNPGLTTGDADMPADWTPYRDGSNKADFAFNYDDKGSFLDLAVTDYKDGEAKWQHQPVEVGSSKYYDFTVTYQSNQPLSVVAEYELDGGGRRFITEATLEPAGLWTTVQANLEVPDGAQTMTVSLVLHRSGTLATRDYHLADNTKPGKPKWERPLVSVTFDDGWASSYSNGLRVLGMHGYKGTFYINPLAIETPDFMTAAQLHDLKNQGHEIAAHGFSHEDMSSINGDRLDFQLREGREYLARAGFPTDHFAPPYGKQDAEVQWAARKYYKTIRTTESGVNTRQSFNPYNIKVFYLENSTKPQEIADALAEAKQNNGWLILVYHRIGPEHASIESLKVESATIATDMVLAHMDLIHKSGVQVRTVAEAYEEVGAQ